MAQTQRPREGKKAGPAIVKIPQLTPPKIKLRANQVYDRAMDSVYKPFLQKLNSALSKDMAALSSIATKHLSGLSVSESRDPNKVQDAVNAALEEYQDKRPNSPLGRYIATGATDFMKGYRGTKLIVTKSPIVAFFSTRFKSKDIKQKVVGALIDASKPLTAGGTRDIYVDLSGLGEKYARQLKDALQTQLGKSPLPISVSYSDTYRTSDGMGTKVGVPSLLLAYAGKKKAASVQG